ncbi:hypothetical protein SAMN05660662_3322 [Blastococcus aurantiacus]|uniref:Uncharacterized protein n=1 Tax=Blastococcus aurantiacus TaxID=1550231 RepID=A0A1G7NRX9_9ACTN|nr:hypothetical protein [Blastococcus aurantiacus]SDF76731.1 hypothetical protein SAMN05660662_3322 [Blastococcus aurantiacus]
MTIRLHALTVRLGDLVVPPQVTVVDGPVGLLGDDLHPDQAGTDLIADRFPAALRAAVSPGSLPGVRSQGAQAGKRSAER